MGLKLCRGFEVGRELRPCICHNRDPEPRMEHVECSLVALVTGCPDDGGRAGTHTVEVHQPL